MGLVPTFLLVALLAVHVSTVTWPTRPARSRSLLSGVFGRSIWTATVLALVAAAAAGVASAEAARDDLVHQPVGPGWSPDIGLQDVARAGGLGLLATLLGGPCVALMLVLDLLALRKLGRVVAGRAPPGPALDVGFGDEKVERPQSADYRSDATPEIAAIGDVTRGRTLVRRAAIVDGVAALLLLLMLGVFFFVTLAVALY